MIEPGLRVPPQAEGAVPAVAAGEPNNNKISTNNKINNGNSYY